MEHISLPSSLVNPQILAGATAPKTETQHAEQQLQRITATQEIQQKPLDERDQEEKRFNNVKKAAQKIVSTNPLSPSVARFTIYKDTLLADLPYVTRFTNINDGKVTLVREPELLFDLNKEQGTLLDGMV